MVVSLWEYRSTPMEIPQYSYGNTRVLSQEYEYRITLMKTKKHYILDEKTLTQRISTTMQH